MRGEGRKGMRKDIHLGQEVVNQPELARSFVEVDSIDVLDQPNLDR